MKLFNHCTIKKINTTFYFICLKCNYFHQLVQEPLWNISLMIAIYIYGMVVLLETTVRIPYVPIIDYSYGYVIDCLYFLDILLTIGSQLTIILYSYIRPIWLLKIETISVLPIEIIANIFFNDNQKIYLLLRSIHVLKVVRIFHFLNFKASLMEINFIYNCLNFTILGIFMAVIAFALSFNVYCIANECEKVDGLEFFCVIITKLSTWGYAVSIENIYLETIILMIAPGYIYIGRGLIMGIITIDYFGYIQHKFLFRSKLIQSTLSMKLININNIFMKVILNFYHILWIKRRGYHFHKDMFNILPESIRHELFLEMYCNALKHSVLFRQSDITLMRFLTSLMTQMFLSEGEIIFEKGSIKNKMIYVVSGVIELISDEDGETPLLSLSSGTCLGETSLLVTQYCGSTLRCKNFVEIKQLTRADFLTIIKYYPKEYKKLVRIVKDRYKEAKKMHEMVVFFNKSTYTRNKDCITIIWLKQMLNTIFREKRHNLNIFLQDENDQEELKSSLFTTKYLDLLSIAKVAELNEYSEILKTTFPYIFHPNSVVIKLWEHVILLATVYMAYYVPKYMFRNGRTEYVDNPYVRFCNYLFLLDIIVQISTSIITNEGTYTTFQTIAKYKFDSILFRIDMFSAFPLEIFTCIFINSTSYLTPVALRANRLLKIIRIVIFFSNLEEMCHKIFYIIFYIKAIILTLYVIYIGDCLLYASVCSFPPYDCQYANDYWTLFSSVQIVTGVGAIGPYDQKYHFGIIYNIIAQTASLILAVTFVYVIVAVILRNPNFLAIQALAEELRNDLETFGIQKNQINRVLRYIETNWCYNSGIHLLGQFNMKNDVPSLLYKIAIGHGYFDILKKVRFFQHLDDDVILAIASYITTHILPANEIVCYAGDISDRLLIVKQGLIEITSDTTVKYFKEYDSINSLACIYQLPIIKTCVTITDCVILSVTYSDLMQVLRKFDAEYETFVNTIQSTNFIKEKLYEISNLDFALHSVKKEKNPSFRYFGRNFELDSIEEYEYYVPYDKLNWFKWIHYLLMRITIHPNGNFFYGWEIMRSIFAILSGIMHSVLLFAICENCSIKYVLYFLDVTAYVDIYVRLHVAFYNDLGILITHPLETAKNYVKHAFLMDVIAVFPFELFLEEPKQLICLLLHSNRILQMLRYLGLTRYIGGYCCDQKPLIFHLHILPHIIVLITFVGSIIASVLCEFDRESTFTSNVECDLSTLAMSPSKFKNNYGLYIQIHCIYILASAVNSIGFIEAPIQSFFLGLVISIFTLIGMIYTYFLMGQLTLYCSGTSARQTFYQASLNNLKQFMNKNNVKEKLQENIISHYMLRWSRQRGKGVAVVSETFYFTLKQDLLYQIYGKTIYAYSILPEESKKFYRNILVFSTHESYMNGAYIANYNDVISQLYIIHRGKVNILNKNNVLMQRLDVGAIFGNIYGNEYHKQEVICTANIDTEILSVSSKTFYMILNKYPNLKPIIQDIIDDYKYYIPSKTKKFKETIEAIDTKIKRKNKCGRLNAILNHAFHPNSTFIEIWQLINCISCYISMVTYTYQAGLSEFNVYFVLLQYTCDLLFAVNFYIQDHLMYVDRAGDWVSDVKQIRKKRRKDKISFLINLISLQTIDILIYLIPTTRRKRQMLLKIFRCNRLLRFIDIGTFYKLQLSKINVNILMLDMNFSYALIMLSLHCMACIIIGYGNMYENNMSVHIEDQYDLPSLKKFKIYIGYLYSAFNLISRMAESVRFPVRTELIIMFILIMCSVPISTSWVLIQAFLISYKLNYLKIMFRNKAETLMYFTQREEISDWISYRLSRYINLIWLKSEGILTPELLKIAPIYISEKIYSDIYLSYVNDHLIFKKCEEDFKRQLIRYITFDLYYDGDYITFKNIINNSMFFIKDGHIEVYDEDDYNTEVRLKELTTHSIFGVYQGFQYLLRHKYTYKAKNNCTILCLNYHHWKHLIPFFPASKEIIDKTLEEYLTTRNLLYLKQ